MRLARSLRRSLVVVAGTAALALAGCTAADAPTAPAQQAARSLAQSTDSTAGHDLLECAPVTEPRQALALLGPLGGELRLGNTVVSVPVGALLTTQLFSIAETPGSLMAVDIHAVGLLDFNFERPVTVTVDYSRCGDVEGPLRAWYIDPETHELLEDMGGVTDPVRRTHTFQTPHLSVYAMAN